MTRKATNPAGLCITSSYGYCRAFLARRRGGKTPNRDGMLVAATVGEKWIGLSRWLDASPMAIESLANIRNATRCTKRWTRQAATALGHGIS